MAEITELHSGGALTSDEALARQRAALKGGGGGGTLDGMEKRIERLEVGLDKIDDRLRGVEIKLATLNERVAHLPSKGYILIVVLGVGAALGALTLFPEQIKALFGG